MAHGKRKYTHYQNLTNLKAQILIIFQILPKTSFLTNMSAMMIIWLLLLSIQRFPEV